MDYIVLGSIYFSQFAVPYAVCWLIQNWLHKKSKYFVVKLLPMAALVVLLFVVICNEISFNSYFLLINIVSGLAGMVTVSLGRLVRVN